MKVISHVMAMLFVFAIHTSSQSQSLKHFEKKAKKTFQKEAYGMALYYSQTILKIDSGHTDALRWSNLAAEKLGMSDKLSDFITKLPAKNSTVVTPEGLFEPDHHKPDALDSALTTPLTLVVKTFNAVDSSALNGTYIGLTNDGFGTGEFFQNNEHENTAVFTIPLSDFFTVTGTKNTFSSGSATISNDGSIRRDTIYRRLYLSPSWGLPLTLYFDHEKPNALHPADSATNLTYEQTWIDYLYRIDDYIEGNTADSSMVARAKAQTKTGLFFANQVDAHFQKLQSLARLLENYLTAGKKITLKIEGYAGFDEQGANKDALVKRRMNSIENYFSFYKNGLLKQWLSSGQLKIIRQKSAVLETSNEAGVGRETNKVIYDLETAKTRKALISLGEIL